MIKVLINGCNGKMGQEVAKAIERNDNFQTICGVDRLDTGDNNFPVYTDTSKISEEPDIIIDFSIPIATFNILKYAQAKKIPIVIATTGFTDEDLERIKEYSKEFPIFLSSTSSTLYPFIICFENFLFSISNGVIIYLPPKVLIFY